MPIYRFTGDVIFSTTLDDNGELHFTIPIEELKALGIPLGKDVCIQVGYSGATVEAGNRTDAYDALRHVVQSFRTPSVPLRTTNERSWDWSRADVLWTYERQLLQFTEDEIADPDSIDTSTRPGRRRRAKLRRILGLRSFVEAHPNLDIRCRDDMSPASRLIVNCGENHRWGLSRHGQGHTGVSITYRSGVNRVHLRDLASELDTQIIPADVHAFNVFMMGVESVAQTNEVESGAVVIHPEPVLEPAGAIAGEDIAF